MSKKSHLEVYLEHDDLLLKLLDDESVGYGVPDLPNWFTWIAPFRCNECHETMILSGEMEAYDFLRREMGNETYYGSTDYFKCPNCRNEITVESLVSYYATGWFCQFENVGADLIQISYFGDYVQELHEKNTELEQLKYEKADLDFRLANLVDHGIRTRGYVLIVEGDDDEEVWNQFIRREYIDMNRISIAKYGEGGLDAAIKAAKFFKGKVLESIPHKLVIDSDNKKREKAEKLERNGINKSEYHILDRKEIESYLMDPQAISRILSVNKSLIEEDFKEHSMIGKEQLDALFRKYIGKKALPTAKGLIARAMNIIPLEIKKIVDEIKFETTKLDFTVEEEEY